MVAISRRRANGGGYLGQLTDCHRMHFRRPKLYLNLLEFPLDDEKI